MLNETLFFTSSLDLSEHPMNKANDKLKIQYYIALEQYVKKQIQNKYTLARLEQYRITFFKDVNFIRVDRNIDRNKHSLINNHFQLWKKTYHYWLICDIALILFDDVLIQNAANEMKSYMTKRQKQQLDLLLKALNNDNTDTTSFAFAEPLILQYRKNINFHKQPVRKFIVTANMSAGKSTLINALIGKPLAQTSQEVCTGNTCYLYNKAFEDNRIHLENLSLSINANKDELDSISWDSKTSIASYFRGIVNIKQRLCIIDTPGVNSAINKNHGTISRDSLKTETFEKVIYVLNANKLGTDEEILHIKWISENIHKEKVIFVLNKLDTFKALDDNISASIEGVRNDLVSLGFENPIICPISAYFALLLKMKHNRDQMTEDEIDEYTFYSKKFKKSIYDLSEYYDDVHEDANDSEILSMSKKCGLYGLEKLLFGGTL